MTSYLNCKQFEMYRMPVGENLSLIVSDIFHIPKYDTNEVDREQKTLENKLEVALLSLYNFGEFFVCREIRRTENIDILL